jgi:hypothetical protein
VLALGCALACAAGANAQHGYTRQIQSGGTANLQTPASPAASFGPELDPALAGGDTHDGGNDATGYTTINRSVNTGGKSGSAHANGSQKAKSNPEINLSFDGLNFYQQRYVADNGNQFSIEPPDQGLCAGNGYVLESTNDVLNIFNTSGASVLPGGKPLSLNQFYGYASAINRSTLQYGPELTDPSCYFDQSTQRWFHVVLTLDRVGTSSRLSGTNHLDLAVSQTASPLGNWTIYRIPVQDDGSQGTPNHNCPGPCLGDYPHIGADAYGIYLTTNEFPFFAAGYHGSQIYAISKQALAANASSVNVVQYDTADPSTNSASGAYGFTIWPAISAQSSPTEQGGIEYMLSSLAVLTDSGVSNQLQLWSLTGTSALSTGGAPTLVSSLVNTEYYGIPGSARQPGTGTNGVGKAPGGGNIDWPLGQCLNDATCSVALNGYQFPYTEVISDLAANDSRMQQVYYANGKLWASLGTGIAYDTTPQTYSEGLAYFVLHPNASATPTASVVQQGYVAAPDLDVTYGTVAVTESGRGVLSFTATGPSNYPGVGYASLDAKIGAGPIHISTPGLGAQDGFSGYVAENYPNPRRPRWGDYGAAVVDGKSIWFAQEYIGQSCTLAQYEAPLFGRCGNTRGALGNWYTRITKATF